MLAKDVEVDVATGRICHKFLRRHVAHSGCSVCGSSLKGRRWGKAYVCLYCRLVIDTVCYQTDHTSSPLPPCISIHQPLSPPSLPSPPTHHWTPSLCSSTLCVVCRATCWSGKKIDTNVPQYPVRCRWCDVSCHRHCLPHLTPTSCDLGSLQPHLLPPWSIYLTPDTPSSDKGSEYRLSPVRLSTAGEYHIKHFPADTHPLFIFVNPNSGGNRGSLVLTQFRGLLNPLQVFNLVEGGPGAGVRLMAEVAGARVLCCGGDGTVGWVLAEMDKMGVVGVTVAVLPLGTGNDLARCLGWGHSYRGKRPRHLEAVLKRVQSGDEVELDRWQVQVQTQGGTEEKIPCGNVMNNYFSVGVDASIAMAFDAAREKNRKRFTSAFVNQVYYGMCGARELVRPRCRGIGRDVSVTCDGGEVSLGSRLQAIVILNIPSMYGGADPWGNRRPGCCHRGRDPGQCMGDGKVELVGVYSSAHAARIKVGAAASAKRLGQGQVVTMVTNRKWPMQVDGEPWSQEPCTITISRKNQVQMMRI